MFMMSLCRPALIINYSCARKLPEEVRSAAEEKLDVALWLRIPCACLPMPPLQERWVTPAALHRLGLHRKN